MTDIEELKNYIINDNINYILNLSYYKDIIKINNFINYYNKLDYYSNYFLSVVCIYENKIDTFKLIFNSIKFNTDEYMFIINISFVLGKTEFIKFIINNYFIFTYDDFLKIYENACIYNNIEIVNLIDILYNFNDYFELAKIICKKSNKLDIISHFINKNRIKNKLINELFQISCIYGNYKISKFIKNNYNIYYDREKLFENINIHRMYYYDCVKNRTEDNYKYDKLYKII